MKKKIINCCVFLSFFSPAVTSLPFLWLLSFFIPPRCLLFWLFLATYLTLIYSQTHKIRKHTGKHAERACTAHQGDKASAASAFFIFKVSFCLKTALSCFFQTQLNIDVNSPPPLSSEQLTKKKKKNFTYQMWTDYDTRTLTDTLQQKQAVLMADLDSTPSLGFVESHSWPGHHQGYIS